MVRLVTTYNRDGCPGVVIEAMEDVAARLVAGGMFRLAEGEAMPEPSPEPEPERDDAPEPAPALDATAFGGDPSPDYSSMTNAELRALAESLGLTPPKKATKERLVELLEGAGG